MDAAFEDDAVAWLIALFVHQVGRIAPAAGRVVRGELVADAALGEPRTGALSGDDATVS